MVPPAPAGASGTSAPDASREENFAAWVRFFENVAADRPTVLVFEDLHWADEALLAFLEYLTTQLAAVPLMILGTARPELFERRPGFAAGGHVNRLELGPLSPAETSQLVTGLLGEPGDHAAVVGQVVKRCDGNPFYAEQSARLLSDAEMEVPLPDSVHAVIAARLDALPPEQKGFLADAAVVGSVFWDGVLTAMDSRDSRQVDGMLSGLLERRLIRRMRESSMEGEREFAFVHALAREVAYRQLPRAARAQRHSAVARWLEVKAKGHPEELSEVLAHHYVTALELARAAGERDLAEPLQEHALRFLTLAGDRALNLDLRAAERFYTAARELSAADGPERAHLEHKLGEAALWSGRTAEAEDYLRRAAEALRAAGDERSAAVALARLARARHDAGAPAREVEGLYREAVALFDDTAPSGELVTVLTEWGRELLNSGERDAGLAAFERVFEVARTLGGPEPPLALSLRGSARAAQGDPRFLEDYRRALEVAEMQGLGIERGRIWCNYALDIGLIEGPLRSLEELDRVLDFAAALGMIAGWARVNRLWALVFAGEWGEALREATELERDVLQWAGVASQLAPMGLIRYLPLVWRGADEEVLLRLSAALDEERDGLATLDVWWGLMVATIVTASYDLNGARVLLAELVATAPSDDDVWLYVLVPEAARVALRCEDAGLAEDLCRSMQATLPAAQFALASV